MLTIRLNRHHVERCRELAISSASPTGRSRVRREEDRAATRLEDQLTGHLGGMAYSLYAFGCPRPFEDARWVCDTLLGKQGDRGYDFPRLRLDVKASRLKPGKDAGTYNLLVRPGERHQGWMYVLALVNNPEDDGCLVHLPGYWLDCDISDSHLKSGGPFAGAYAVPVKVLNKLPPYQYDGVTYAQH